MPQARHSQHYVNMQKITMLTNCNYVKYMSDNNIPHELPQIGVWEGREVVFEKPSAQVKQNNVIMRKGQ